MHDIFHRFTQPISYSEYYQPQWQAKKSLAEGLIAKYSTNPVIDYYPSVPNNFRARIEFAIKKIDQQYHYVMFAPKNKQWQIITQADQALSVIQQAMPTVIEWVNQHPIIHQRCFQINFRGNREGELLITLIYHKQLDQQWLDTAYQFAELHHWQLVGRYRKSQLCTHNNRLQYSLNVNYEYQQQHNQTNLKQLRYWQTDNTFTQPNPYTNEHMLAWLYKNLSPSKRDLLELYCGNGGFAIALSDYFRQILATEVVKQAISLAQENKTLNAIENLQFVRLSASETAQALIREREFRRLREIDIESYDFSTILVDPPRAGLDNETTGFASQFDNIIYFSCNPETFQHDLNQLTQTHLPINWAIFDQFPYTPHLEMAVLLQRQKEN